MNAEQLSAALQAGQRVYGTCVTSTSPQWPPAMAAAGIDFVFLDTEHVPIDRAQLAWMCRAYGAAGLAPIVRIPQPDPVLACMALDGGAVGVVAPYVETVEEVQQLRGAVKLRPLKGERLQRVLDEEDALTEEEATYLAEFNRSKLCIVNIESVPAIEALDRILCVPDLDGLLIGPHDLSISLGVPEQYHHPRFTEAVRQIIETARAADVAVGFHFSFGVEEGISWAEMGANLIVHGTDLLLVRDTLRRELGQYRSALGEEDTKASDAHHKDGPAAI